MSSRSSEFRLESVAFAAAVRACVVMNDNAAKQCER